MTNQSTRVLLDHRLPTRINEPTMKTRDITAEERVQELFQPDTLLPSQYFDRIRRRASFDGERRLMVAVLEDADAWIESDDKSWIFSFENICDVLGIDATYLRKGLRRWKQQAGGDRGQVVAFRDDVRDDAPDAPAIEPRRINVN